jgi:hypothetical protein
VDGERLADVFLMDPHDSFRCGETVVTFDDDGRLIFEAFHARMGHRQTQVAGQDNVAFR